MAKEKKTKGKTVFNSIAEINNTSFSGDKVADTKILDGVMEFIYRKSTTEKDKVSAAKYIATYFGDDPEDITKEYVDNLMKEYASARSIYYLHDRGKAMEKANKKTLRGKSPSGILDAIGWFPKPQEEELEMTPSGYITRKHLMQLARKYSGETAATFTEEEMRSRGRAILDRAAKLGFSQEEVMKNINNKEFMAKIEQAVSATDEQQGRADNKLGGPKWFGAKDHTNQMFEKPVIDELTKKYRNSLEDRAKKSNKINIEYALAILKSIEKRSKFKVSIISKNKYASGSVEINFSVNGFVGIPAYSSDYIKIMTNTDKTFTLVVGA